MPERFSFNLLKVLLPNLCIFYAFSTNAFNPVWSHREVYGNEETYLDLYFKTNPKGPLQRELASQSLPFFGFLVTGSGEERVTGHYIKENGKSRYLFSTSQGQFSAELKKQRGACEPLLDYRIEFSSKTRKAGTLKAGYCP